MVDAVKTSEGKERFTTIINWRLREALGTAVSGGEIELHSLSSTSAYSQRGDIFGLRSVQ
jgi:hypothetical protein